MLFKDIIDIHTLQPKWDVIETIPEFAALKETGQHVDWHTEGNVWNHTHLVAEEMYKAVYEIREISKENNLVKVLSTMNPIALMAASLCHDLGKATTTHWDEETQNYVCTNHGKAGEEITRRLFFDEEITLRERVCFLVRWHMTLHHIFDDEEHKDKGYALLLRGNAPFTEMCTLYACDCRGSRPNDKVEQIDLDKRMEEIRDELKRYVGNDELLTKYDKTHLCKEGEETMRVAVLIGIAGSGKTTFIKEHFPEDTPIVSRDIIRQELGYVDENGKFKGDKKQEDRVTNIFNKRCKEYAEKNISFVIDNVNLKLKYRNAYHELLKDYPIHWDYLYIEPPTIDIAKKRREGQINPNEIDRMVSSIDFPTPAEYHRIEVKKSFDIQAEIEMWHDETRFLSNGEAIVNNPHFDNVIKSGLDALEYIIEDITKRPSHLFIAACSIDHGLGMDVKRGDNITDACKKVCKNYKKFNEE